MYERQNRIEWKSVASARCPSDQSRANREVEIACQGLLTKFNSSGSVCQNRVCPRAPITITAPTYGSVACSTIAPHGIITIYLARHDNHLVFAPISGQVIDINTCQVTFFREELQYVADAERNGRVAITIEHPTGLCVEMWLEVGEKSYITDRVRLTLDNGRPLQIGTRVRRGQRIGEIISGSLAEVHLPVQQADVRLLVAQGDRVVGGKSRLAVVTCEEEEEELE